MPLRSILEAAAVYNPHGFGFCTPTKRYRTLDFDRFIERLETVKDDEPCIIHFRYATEGSVKVSNCHPFKCDNIFFAHNGVISIETKNDKTDSETFFRERVITVIDEYGFDSYEFDNLMSRYTGSRFAIMKEGIIKTFGGFQKLQGCYYSNLRFYHLIG
jgi:predicted glutamine amidotransferase